MLSKLPDDAPQVLFSGLATAQGHLCALSMGRELLAQIQEKARELDNAPLKERPGMLEGMQSQWQTLEMAEKEGK